VMTDKVGMMWKDSVVAYVKVLSQTLPAGLRKNLSQNSWSPVLVFNL
jgi:hypothetical protein